MQLADGNGGHATLPLAYGDLTAQDAADLDALKALVRQRLGFDCHDYKERCLRRRIGVRMRARGVHSYRAYAGLLEGDDDEYRRLFDAITINVSKFFRNHDTWAVVRDVVLPELFALAADPIRIWSAAVAGGEEAFTMAILLREYAELHGLDTSRFRIVGTDIDRASLDVAERAVYGAFSFTETPSPARARWFDGADAARVAPEIRSMVTFAQHDLIRDVFPEKQHLILCRNMLIYLERNAQQRLFGRFADALDPGGFLVLGKVETLIGPAAASFRPVAARQRVFQRA
jgi:chemotaxis protein methyltransferase CheR